MQTQKTLKLKHSRDLPTALLFLLPSLLIFTIFYFYPMLDAILLSFYKWDRLSTPQVFIGLENYIRLLNDPDFWNSLRVTFYYTLGVTVISILLGLVLAVALNQSWLVLKSFWRTLYFLPFVTSTVAAAMVWMLLFHPSFGIVNTILRSLGGQKLNWLVDVRLALSTVMTLGIWRRVGFTIIVYLAALQTIPKDYYESAQVDGAGGWHTFSRITFPLLKPTTIMLCILGLIDSFLVFDQVLVMTRGGPANATMVLGVFLYTNAFTYFKMGYGAAISVITLAIIASITLIQWRFIGFGKSEIEVQ